MEEKVRRMEVSFVEAFFLAVSSNSSSLAVGLDVLLLVANSKESPNKR